MGKSQSLELSWKKPKVPCIERRDIEKTGLNDALQDPFC